MDMTKSSYPLGGWLLPGGMVVLGFLAFIASVSSMAAYWGNGMGGSLFRVLIALIFLFVAYFYYPVEIRVGEHEVWIRYLLGPRLVYRREDVEFSLLYKTLVGRVQETSRRRWLVGSFKFNLMLLRNSDELLWRLSSRL